MAKRRRFTLAFKAEVVIEALSGESSQAELYRKPHNLSEDQLSKRSKSFSSLYCERISLTTGLILPIRGCRLFL